MFRQEIKNLVYICEQMGVSKAVIAPGSRNTPLTLAFTQSDVIECHTVTDERSAAFLALGMSQYKEEPVVLVCTSGTAALNFASAIAEAFYQHLPLIVLTADRPVAWIDQADGQTIRQQNLYSGYCKASFQLPTDYPADAANTANEHFKSIQWQCERTVSQAIDMALQFPKGPVHLNVPLNEPLYVQLPESHSNPKIIRSLSTDILPDAETVKQFASVWNNAGSKMIVVGNFKRDEAINTLLNEASELPDVLVIAENLSNISGDKIISSPDLFFSVLSDEQQAALQPDLLITIGHSAISKKLKQFLRKYKARNHWQLQSGLPYADTYQSLQVVLPVRAVNLLSDVIRKAMGEAEFMQVIARENTGESVVNQQLHKKIKKDTSQYFDELPASDMWFIRNFIQMIPENAVLQLSNSTVVRISQLLETRTDLLYYCNRGTSGIDGSLSTAVGSAMISGKETILITGDLSFLYDSNGLWNNELPANLKILLLNNGGANIFRMIGNQTVTADCQRFFDAPHQVNTAMLTNAYGVHHQVCKSKENFKEMVQECLNQPVCSVLEVQTEMEQNVHYYQNIFKYIQSNEKLVND